MTLGGAPLFPSLRIIKQGQFLLGQFTGNFRGLLLERYFLFIGRKTVLSFYLS